MGYHRDNTVDNGVSSTEERLADLSSIIDSIPSVRLVKGHAPDIYLGAQASPSRSAAYTVSSTHLEGKYADAYKLS